MVQWHIGGCMVGRRGGLRGLPGTARGTGTGTGRGGGETVWAVRLLGGLGCGQVPRGRARGRGVAGAEGWAIYRVGAEADGGVRGHDGVERRDDLHLGRSERELAVQARGGAVEEVGGDGGELGREEGGHARQDEDVAALEHRPLVGLLGHGPQHRAARQLRHLARHVRRQLLGRELGADERAHLRVGLVLPAEPRRHRLERHVVVRRTDAAAAHDHVELVAQRAQLARDLAELVRDHDHAPQLHTAPPGAHGARACQHTCTHAPPGAVGHARVNTPAHACTRTGCAHVRAHACDACAGACIARPLRRRPRRCSRLRRLC